jgi:hypothetical protein
MSVASEMEDARDVLQIILAFFQIESTTAAQVFGQSLQNTAHDTGANPLLETAVAGLVGGIPFGQIGPRCAAA